MLFLWRYSKWLSPESQGARPRSTASSPAVAYFNGLDGSDDESDSAARYYSHSSARPMTSPSLYSSHIDAGKRAVSINELASPGTKRWASEEARRSEMFYINLIVDDSHAQLLVTDGTSVTQAQHVLTQLFGAQLPKHERVVALYSLTEDMIYPLSLVCAAPAGFATHTQAYQIVTDKSGIQHASAQAYARAIQSDNEQTRLTERKRPQSLQPAYDVFRSPAASVNVASPVDSSFSDRDEIYSPAYFRSQIKALQPSSSTAAANSRALASPGRMRKKWFETPDQDEFDADTYAQPVGTSARRVPQHSTTVKALPTSPAPSIPIASSANLYIANVLTAREMEELEALQTRCGLHLLSLTQVHAIFKRHVRYGRLGRQQFDAALRQLLQALVDEDDDDSPERSVEVMQIMHRMYDILAESTMSGAAANGTTVSALRFSYLTVGLSLICLASTEEKLRLVFTAFDSNADDFVSLSELSDFFSAFYTVALDLSVTLQAYFDDVGVSHVADIARHTAQEAFDAVQSADGRISFGEFAEWFRYVNSIGPDEQDDATEAPSDEEEMYESQEFASPSRSKMDESFSRSQSSASQLVSPLIKGIGMRYKQARRVQEQQQQQARASAAAASVSERVNHFPMPSRAQQLLMQQQEQRQRVMYGLSPIKSNGTGVRFNGAASQSQSQSSYDDSDVEIEMQTSPSAYAQAAYQRPATARSSARPQPSQYAHSLQRPTTAYSQRSNGTSASAASSLNGVTSPLFVHSSESLGLRPKSRRRKADPFNSTDEF